jgi:hypothetical protein
VREREGWQSFGIKSPYSEVLPSGPSCGHPYLLLCHGVKRAAVAFQCGLLAGQPLPALDHHVGAGELAEFSWFYSFPAKSFVSARCFSSSVTSSFFPRSFLLWRGLTLARHYDEAASHCEKLPADYRAKPECLGRARLGQGRIEEALRVLAPLRDRGNWGYLGYAYARAGRRDEAGKLAAEVAPNPFNEALVYAGLGDKGRTLEAIERMPEAHAAPVEEHLLVCGEFRVNVLSISTALPIGELTKQTDSPQESPAITVTLKE